MQTPAPQKLSGLVKVGRTLMAGLVGLAALAAAGGLYESLARAQDLSRVSAPGRLIDVGGHKLHLLCAGQSAAGQPTVILEAGAGGWSIHWRDFQAQAAGEMRVCAYDRAGFGWSEAGPQPRTATEIVMELHILLDHAGESGPFILVGASRGGQYVRLYRDLHPEQVAGLVLVDAEPEDFRALAPAGQSLNAQNQLMFSAVAALTRVGFFRLLGGDPSKAPEVPGVPFLAARLPAAERAAYLAVEGQPQCFEALWSEEAAGPQREAQLRQAQPLGDLPLVVLAHGLASAPPPGVSPEQAAQTEQVWQDLQKKLAGLSSRGTYLQAARSGHNIALDQPEMVLEAVRSMVK